MVQVNGILTGHPKRFNHRRRKHSGTFSQQRTLAGSYNLHNKMDNDTIIFWNAKGEPILTITGQDSSVLLEIFDTVPMRGRIEAYTGEKIDNTSEENSDELEG